MLVSSYFKSRSCCGPIEPRFRLNAKHRNACFRQFGGIKSCAFLKGDTSWCKIAAAGAVHERLDLLERGLLAVFGKETFSRFGAGMFFPITDYKKHSDNLPHGSGRGPIVMDFTPAFFGARVVPRCYVMTKLETGL